MKKKSILVAALLSQGLFTFANVDLKMDKLTIAAGETKTVNVRVDLTDKSEISTFQMDIQLPAGLHFTSSDAVTTNTDYGWTLVRSFDSADLDPDEGRFFAYARNKSGKLTPGNVEEKLNEGLLFSFDVTADDTFNPSAVGEIEFNDVKLTDGDKPAPYTVEGTINTENGKVTGIYRLIGDDNNKVTIDGGLTEETVQLNSIHWLTIKVELTNREILDNPMTPFFDESTLSGDKWIRGLQGTIHLPKGIKIKGEGEVINSPTTNEELYIGNAEPDGEGTKVNFSIFASKAPLRDCSVYGIDLFQFDIQAEETDDYVARQSVITIDNFVATRLNDVRRYTLDDVITITVDNPNQVALEDVWNPFLADLQAAWQQQVDDVPGNVNVYPPLLEQEQAAQDAIDALKDAITDAYNAGKLTGENQADDVIDYDDLDDSYDFNDLIAEANKQIEEIGNAAAAAAEKAKKQVEAAKKAIEVDYALPDKCNKDDNRNQAEGTWQIAEKVLENAILQAEKDGTQANDGIFDEELKGLAEAQAAVIEKADMNYKMAELAIRDNVLPDNCKADDTQETFGKTVKALEDAMQNAVDKGELAWPGIFDAEIAALPVAIAEVIAKAEANNALAADAIVDYGAYTEEYTASAEYQEIRENEDVKDAVAAFDAAKDALEAAVEKAEADGTQAKDDIYKDEIDALEAAMQALKDEIAAKHDIAVENEEEIEDQLAESYEPLERFDDIDETQEVSAAMEAWEKAKEALEDALQNSKDNGLLADDQYLDENGEPKPLDDLIDDVANALDALDKAIEEATAIANEVDGIIEEGMNALNEEIQGRDNEVKSELEKAKVVDPATVTQEDGKLPKIEAGYVDLLNNLYKLIYGYDPITGEVGLQADVMFEKDEYLAGKAPITALRSYIDNKLPVLKKELKKAAVEIIVNYLKDEQRGDVGGDGRWTTNDYARLRKVILSEEYPTSPAIDEDGNLEVAFIFFDKDGNPDTEKLYEFYRMDINQDGKINVGDAQAALNYTFYGSMLGPVAEARTADKSAETMSATMTGNVIAIDLSNSRQYSAMQLDVVLAEGMSVTAVNASGRTTGYNVASAELANGATRILLTASEAGQAFEGTEGSVLFIEVAGAGQVDFRNIILADLNAGTAEFNLNGVNGGTTGIAGAKTAAEGEKVFDLGGRVMNALKKGVNIIRRADGSSQKVIKK